MDIFALVRDIEKVIGKLRTERGEFTLAMLYNNSLEAKSSWNLIVSAPWLDKMTLTESTRLIANALNQNLGLENQISVSQVTVLKTSEPFVRDMTNLYPVLKPGFPIPVTQLNSGDLSGSGFILYSKEAA
jgi:hypothetical protein